MLSFLLHFYSKIFSGCTTVMEIMSTTVKDDVDTDVEDETAEEQTALKNILSSKDTPLHTELFIKNEEEDDKPLLNTECINKDEAEEDSEDIEGKDAGSVVQLKQSSVEITGTYIYMYTCYFKHHV